MNWLIVTHLRLLAHLCAAAWAGCSALLALGHDNGAANAAVQLIVWGAVAIALRPDAERIDALIELGERTRERKTA